MVCSFEARNMLRFGTEYVRYAVSLGGGRFFLRVTPGGRNVSKRTNEATSAYVAEARYPTGRLPLDAFTRSIVTWKQGDVNQGTNFLFFSYVVQYSKVYYTILYYTILPDESIP